MYYTLLLTFSLMALGDRSLLPNATDAANSDALGGAVDSLNQFTPTEEEKERLGPQDMQEKIYQEDLAREQRQEQEEKRKLEEKENQ